MLRHNLKKKGQPFFIKALALSFLVFILIPTFLSAWHPQKLEDLAVDPTWLKLLHYKDGKSSITDKNFFIDEEGRTSSLKELKATLKAYGQKFTKDESANHAQCRYPARYFWLSKQLKLEDYTTINSHCKRLLKWKLLKNTKSISVVFVSGYLGNPASAFGHSFLKINQSKESSKNLFDTTISYGALLPEKYNMPEYIFNGMTGGYEAAYSDKYYYNQDVIYSNQEFRDMWEYRLNLSQEKQTLFLLHAWELMGKKFQYFFLNRNCGYKVSEFLELVFDDSLKENATTWYAPIETFHRLKELDEKHHHTIINQVIYIPSMQQKLYSHYESLDAKEKTLISDMIENNLNIIPLKFSNLSSEKKGNALDFILSYQKYNLENEEKSKKNKFMKPLLMQRLHLPMRKKPLEKVKEPLEIGESNKPSYVGLSSDTDAFSYHWSPFALESRGYNSLDGDELVVLDTKLTLKNKQVKLSKFDLIRILKLKTNEMPFQDHNPFSWNLNIGMDNLENEDYFVKTGAGFASDLGAYTKIFSMLNISAHTEEGHYRVTPNIGLFFNFNHLKSSLLLGYEKEISFGRDEWLYEFNVDYKLSTNIALFSMYKRDKDEDLTLGLKYFY